MYLLTLLTVLSQLDRIVSSILQSEIRRT